MENAVNWVLKRRLTVVGPFSCNKSHIEVVASFLEKYSKVKLQELKEKLVLANFGLSIFIWLKLYSNIFPQKLMAWEKTLPLCYASNKLHYARYSTHCIQHLQQLKKCHRGSLDESRSSMSIRRREFGIEQTIYIDLAAELTDMRNSKTTGIHPFQWVYFNFNIWFNCFLIKFSNLTRKICILKSWAQAPSWFRGDILIAVKISMGGKDDKYRCSSKINFKCLLEGKDIYVGFQ